MLARLTRHFLRIAELDALGAELRSMIAPKLKTLLSADLDRPLLPADPEDCAILLEATIGPQTSLGGDIFAFTVITPAALTRKRAFAGAAGYSSCRASSGRASIWPLPASWPTVLGRLGRRPRRHSMKITLGIRPLSAIPTRLTRRCSERTLAAASCLEFPVRPRQSPSLSLGPLGHSPVPHE